MDTYKNAVIAPDGTIVCTVPAERKVDDNGRLCRLDNSPVQMAEVLWPAGATLRPLTREQHDGYHGAMRPWRDACEAINAAFSAKLRQHVMIHGADPTEAEVAAICATLPAEPARTKLYLGVDGSVSDKPVAEKEPVEPVVKTTRRRTR